MTLAPEPVLPRADRRRSRWPGLVWAIPLAALIVVGYLGIQAIAHRGITVTVTFDRAAGARPGETKVLYQGVEAGELVKIVPNQDGRRLDFKLRLLPESKPGLNTNARFWLIGATPNLTDLSSLKAVVEGVAIGYAPGEGGSPTRVFRGLESAPTVLPGDKGTSYRLDAHKLGTVEVGSAVLFHGFAIGKVTEVEFNGEAGFRLAIFVFRPYDSLIKPGTWFWRSSPVRLAFNGGSVDASLAPASTIFTGGIDVEVPAEDTGRTQSPANSAFTLYASQDAARQGLSGLAFRYDFAFDGAAGDLEEGAPVTLLGFQVGEVESARLDYHAGTAKPFTAVTALLYSKQLPPAEEAAPPGTRSATDAQVRRLLRIGFRARLVQTPALVGAASIALVQITGAPPADFVAGGANPRIPAAPGSSNLEDLTSQADQILTKVNHIPLEAIGADLKQVTGRLNALAASPALADSLAHLQHTVAELDETLTEVKPQLGPLMIKLNQTAGDLSGTALAARRLLDSGGGEDANLPRAIDQLSDAARSVRSLADYLDRHPEAIIRGKRPDKP